MFRSRIGLRFCFGILTASGSFGCSDSGSCAAKPPAIEKDNTSKASHENTQPNRLAKETSPYLLLHAHNPVDWYPWGPEAFDKAKREGKMIFLSIGYSSCYWCHVMERESFTDDDIAKRLNEHFIAIKVDREERPDVDEIYMTALQIYYSSVGSPQGGGWPMSMFLTPDAEPIMGGTYLPPRDRDGMVGFLTLLDRLQTAWTENEPALRKSAVQLAEIVRKQLRELPVSDELPKLEASESVLDELSRRYDPEFAGFGYSPVNPRMPKFPEPSNLVFLLDRARRDRAANATDRKAERILIHTLERMAAGGIYDHVGGGFHRYSTDRFWDIPHFEKMLYDNGQLVSLYAEAYELTGREAFRRVVEQTLDFVTREMTTPDGGFFSALDAETDGEEGRYYAWDRDTLTGLLDADEFKLAADVYGIGETGNFEGRYVLLFDRPLKETADAHKWTEVELLDRITPIRKRLFAARQQRERPLLDTKVLTAWNGLMIRGFADAGRILKQPEYIDAAERAARFLLDHVLKPDGRLLRTHSNGQSKLNAYLDDYAFLADGLIALWQATGDKQWLDEADTITSKSIELFWDPQRGGFFFTSSDHERLLARSKDPADSALPSGNGVTIGNLIVLADALDRPAYRERAEATLRAFGGLWQRVPYAMPRMSVARAAYSDDSK